jgi:hypothetical protein
MKYARAMTTTKSVFVKMEKTAGVTAWSLGLFRKTSLWAGFLFMMALPSASNAIQPDAEYLVREKQFGEQWAADDKQVQNKLAALEKKFGKKPNIIFILGDDIGYTELGSYGGGKVRGFSTPNLDRMADEGMRLLSFYSEPSCTPTRAALMSGRHPVRMGLLGVLFPGSSGMGLVDDEVTVAELLSKAGYHTGMFGKWHLGDDPGMTPIEQGFDEAVWSEGNPPWWGFHQGVKSTDSAGYVNIGAFVWAPGPNGFPYDTGGIMSGKKGEEPKLVAPFTLELYDTMDTDVADDVIDFIERKAKGEKPFFAYYAGKGNHFWGANPDFMNQPAGTNNSAQMAEHDHNVGRVLNRLQELGIAENTLVVWMSDNGPMYAMHPHGGYSLLREKRATPGKGVCAYQDWSGGPEQSTKGKKPSILSRCRTCLPLRPASPVSKARFPMTASRMESIRVGCCYWVKANPDVTISFSITRTSWKPSARTS